MSDGTRGKADKTEVEKFYKLALEEKKSKSKIEIKSSTSVYLIHPLQKEL